MRERRCSEIFKALHHLVGSLESARVPEGSPQETVLLADPRVKLGRNYVAILNVMKAASNASRPELSTAEKAGYGHGVVE